MSGLLAHAWFGGLFADPDCADILSPAAELARYRKIEAAWSMAQADIGTADPAICEQAAKHIMTCQIGDAILRAGVVQDGVPIPAFVRALKSNAPNPIKDVLHSGLTSQDVMDTALILSLGPVFDLFRMRLEALRGGLTRLAEQNESRSLMGYTRMQAALPITVDVRIATWLCPLGDYITKLDQIAGQMKVLQWGGPVGLRYHERAGDLGPAFAARLGVRDPGHAWHTTRADIAELGSFIARLTGTLGKMGQDVAMMAPLGPDDIALNSGGSSSAMPHKQNPILAELLVTIAQYTAQQATILNVAMVHEPERSGTAWVLKFMPLPDLLQLCGCALVKAQLLVNQIASLGSKPV